MSKDTLPSPHFSPAYAGARPTRPFSPGRPVTHLALFAATVVSVYLSSRPTNPLAWFTTSSVFESVAFSCAVMGILLAHELGHYIAGRLHGVQLTLPYFIPAPFAFGTMGAVIRMKVVKKRLQLLDVGASGPLAGMAVALPLAIAGIALSPIEEVPKGAHLILGDNLLFAGIVRLVHGPVAEGYDVFLHPIGLAAWFGFLVTALNLMPASQLDGGHIVKALVGRRHAAISRFVFLVLTVWGALGDAILVDPRLALTGALYVAGAVTLLVTRRFKKYERRILFALFLAHFAWATVVEANSVAMPWMVWSVLLFAFRLDHPPIEDEHAPLPFRRRAAGWASLALFVLTFTPMPITITGI